MTVLKSDAKSPVYVSTGEAGQAYPLGFAVIDPGHIKVAVDGAYVDRSRYTVTDSGVRFGVPVPSGQTVVIVRDTPFDQQTDIQNNTPFYAEIMETAIDKLTMMCQQLREKLNRGLVVPPDTQVDQKKLYDEFVRFTENIEDWLNHIDASLAGAEAARDAAGVSERNAKASENAASASELRTKESERNAKASENAASVSASAASGSAQNASGSASAAKASEDASKASENAASVSASDASGSASAAKSSENAAKASETAAKNSELLAGGFKDGAEAASRLAGDRYNQANQARIAAEAARDGASHFADNAGRSETNAGESEKNAETWAEGSDPDVEALGGTHSSKVHSGVSEAYATAPFGQTVGESVSLAGATLNAVVTKDTVDSAIGAGPSGSENRFYTERGKFVALPDGMGVGANTDLSNLSFTGEQRFAYIGERITRTGAEKMGYDVFSFNKELRAGTVYSLMEMDEVNVSSSVFSVSGNTIGFTFTGDVGEGFPANVHFPFPSLENMEALSGYIHPEEGGVYVVMGNGGVDRLVVTTDEQKHPVAAEVLLYGGGSAPSGANTALSNLSPEGEARFNAKANKAVAAQELAGASVALQPGRYYTWAASGACAVSYGAWDAEKLEVSELRMSVASGATVSFPEGTVLKGDAIEGGKAYIVSVSHDATGYVVVAMERA